MKFTPFRIRQMSIRWAAIFGLVLILASCNGDGASSNPASRTGSVIFNIVLHGGLHARQPQTGVIDCTGQGIATVEAVVYDAQHASVAEGGPWDCDTGQGTIAAVPAGSGRTVVVLGRDSAGAVIFRGQKAGINVVADREHNAGTIDCYAFVPSLQSPADGSAVQAGEMKLEWSAVDGASAYRVKVSPSSDLSDPVIEATSAKASLTPTGLDYEQTYYWQVVAEDVGKNRGLGSAIWSYTSPANTSPVAKIISPEKGSTYIAGKTSEFSGSGSDNDDGELSGPALVWDSDAAGRLGEGQTCSVSGLDPGTHHITLTATDSAGAVGMDTVVITVATTRWPDTGQTDSHTDTPGEDADYDLYQPVYTKLDPNGNDLPDNAQTWVMVRDEVTGLIWEVKTDDGSIHDKDNQTDGIYVDFLDPINNSKFGGYSDWRVPTPQELYTIMHKGKSSAPLINSVYFPNIMLGYYVTNTSYAVNFEYGTVTNKYSNSNMYWRVVRGGEPAEGLVDNGDGTVTDKETGLMWQKFEVEVDGKVHTMTWEEAIIYCEALELAGYDDWRLPNINELQSIFDYLKNTSPLIDTTKFPDAKYFEVYRSSTTCDHDKDSSWFVLLDTDIAPGIHCGSSSKTEKTYVRAVRGGR